MTPEQKHFMEVLGGLRQVALLDGGHLLVVDLINPHHPLYILNLEGVPRLIGFATEEVAHPEKV